MARSKLTPEQREYDRQWKKEERRIKAEKKDLERRGYKVDKDFVPTKPKVRNKKSLENLKNFKGKKYYDKATYIDPETGEAYKGMEGREQEKRNKRLERYRNKKPEFDFIDKIIELIELMFAPTKDLINSTASEMMFFSRSEPRSAIYNIEYDLMSVINTMNDKIAQLRKASLGEVEAYHQYIEQNMGEIYAEIMDCIYNESNHDAFVQRIYRVIALISHQPMTLAQIDTFDSFYDVYQSEDFEDDEE